MKDDCGSELYECAAQGCRRTTDIEPEDETWYCRSHVYLTRDEPPERGDDNVDRAVAAYERSIYGD